MVFFLKNFVLNTEECGLDLSCPEPSQVIRGTSGISKCQAEKVGYPTLHLLIPREFFGFHSISVMPSKIDLVGSVEVFVEVRPSFGSGGRGQAEVTKAAQQEVLAKPAPIPTCSLQSFHSR